MNPLRFSCVRWPALALALLGMLAPAPARADFSGTYAPANWVLDTGAGDGSVNTTNAPASIALNGSDNFQRGVVTKYSITVASATTISFSWQYSTTDSEYTDPAGYEIDGTRVQLVVPGDGDVQQGTVTNLALSAGSTFAFYVDSTDGCCGRGILTISDFPLGSVDPAEIAVYNGSGTGGAERTDNSGTLSFGDVAVGGSSSAQTFTLENTGAEDLTLSGITLGGTDAAQFSLDLTGLDTVLAADETTTFTVTFAPNSVGAKTAVVNIGSDDANENPFRINVSGNALPSVEFATTTQPLTASEGLAGGGQIYRPMPGVINAANRVAFKAFGAIGTGAIAGSNDSLLLTDSSGTLRVIGREGAQVDAGTTSSLLGLLTEHLLTEDGQTVAFDRITGSATPLDQAYVSSGDGETLETLVRTGDSAAGGGLFRAPMPGFVADGDGRVYFVANLSGTGVNARNDSGLWQDDAGVQTLIAREGSDVSSVTTDAAWLGMVLPRVSAAGDGAAFVAFLQNNPSNSRQRTDGTKNLVVLDGNENGLSLVARKGDVVPDTSSATLVNVLGVSRSATGAHAVLGLLKFDANTTRNNDLVLVSVSGGTKRLVAQEGVTSIGGSLVRNITEYYAVGNDGVIFLTDSALCRWTVAGGISVLAQTGSAAPGTAANFTRMTSLSVSEGGAVALLSMLSNGRTGLWRALPGDSLSLVLTTATATTVNGTPRTVLAMGLHRSAGTAGAGGGAGAAINDAGTIFATLSVGSGLHVARRFYP